MSEWIKCSDNLPVCIPVYGPQVSVPTYDWVIVSDGHSRFAIARYAHENVNGKLIPCWEFFETVVDYVSCPYAGDASDVLYIKDIRYWMPIYDPEEPNE